MTNKIEGQARYTAKGGEYIDKTTHSDNGNLCRDYEYLDGLDWHETYGKDSRWLVRCKTFSTNHARSFLHSDD